MMPKFLNKVIWILLLGLWGQPGFSQSIKQDLDLIRSMNHETVEADQHDHHVHAPEFLLHDHPSAFIKYNPLTLGFGSLMWLYQSFITEQLSSACLYSPTCSSYSKSLIQDFGLGIGIILTADRLTRCNRLALYDYPASEIDREIQRIRQSTDYYKLRQ